MDFPSELLLRDVRCFDGEQQGILRPITLLVGENSTGKTTFLGCYRVLHHIFSQGWDLGERPDVNFNLDPFLMGSFRNIARSNGSSSGYVNQFSIGMTLSPSSNGNGNPYKLLVTFGEQGSQPTISSLKFTFGEGDFFWLRETDDYGTVIETSELQVECEMSIFMVMRLVDILTRHATWRPTFRVLDNPSEFSPVFDCLDGFFKDREPFHIRVPDLPALIPIAPLRSKPKRTYDPVREIADPEGDHVPMLMMRLFSQEKREWLKLHDELVLFGRNSGLFSDMTINRHGDQMSDPFQLQVKIRSAKHFNIMDVGYGVSQSLPIIVDILNAPNAKGDDEVEKHVTFLLQEPEVHLHPRAQAELANLFAQSYKNMGIQFHIETHSDYIVDRIRLSVRKGIVNADDVSILYFDPIENGVRIHSMTLDDFGNLQGAPEGYRAFFLNEADEVLGFDA